jgi:hypothetical protein
MRALIATCAHRVSPSFATVYQAAVTAIQFSSQAKCNGAFDRHLRNEKKRMSLKQKIFAGSLALTLATFMLAGAASSAKRISYADAWRLCQEEISKSGAHAHWVSNERYHRGAACMHKYGHHI